MDRIQTLQQELDTMGRENQEWLDKHTTKSADGTKTYNFDENLRIEFRNRNDAMAEKTKELETAKDDARLIAQHEQNVKTLNQGSPSVPFGGMNGDGNSQTMNLPAFDGKSLGQRFIESDTYKQFCATRSNSSRFEGIGEMFPGISLKTAAHFIKSQAQVDKDGSVKTVVDMGSAFAPFSPRTDLVVPYANRRPLVADLIPQTQWDYQSVMYMAQTTQTNSAAPTAETGQKGESALAWTLETATMQFIAHFIPITRQIMLFAPALMDIINQQMVYLLQLEEETQLLTGDGNSPNLQGFLTVSGLQTQAKSTDPVPTAILKGITKVRGTTPGTGFAEPDAIILHPNDYQDIVTLQDGTGRYIFGDPGLIDGVQRLWGKPMVVTPAETENTALLGDFQTYSRIWRNNGVRMYISDSHASFFITNELALLVEQVETLTIQRPSAFCKVTGI